VRRIGAGGKAPLWGAFFVLALLAAPAAVAGECAAPRADARVVVTRVHDGDTVTLADGRRVRLIGLDTPEMNYGSGRPEPLADEARQALESLLGGDRRLILQYGRERTDRYDRLLAHAFLPDGRSVTALLLERGLATALVMPPNLWNLDCYAAAERRARGRKLGVWTLPAYTALDADRATAPGKGGYRVVTGRVTRVQRNRGGVWLRLGQAVSLRIAPESEDTFAGCRLEALEGQRLLARGWLQGKRHGVLQLRHPVQLERMPAAAAPPGCAGLAEAPGADLIK